MSKKYNFTPILILLTLFIEILVPEEHSVIAVSTKAKGNVSHRAWNSEDYFNLLPAKALNDGDHIQTGDDGFGALVYLDDKSMVKIKENTNFEVLGTKSQGQISKRLKINNGTVKASIQKGKEGGFVIETPTSVATVKGTEFWMVTSSEGDKVFGLEGTVELMNIISGTIVMVGSNTTGTSLQTGEINLTTTDPDEVPKEDENQEINEFEIDTVFHLGAQAIVNSARRMPLQTFEANIRGTYNLLEACRAVRPYGLATRIVIASSDKAYGVHNELPYTEDMVLRGRHPYDVSKVCADLIAQGYAETYGLQIGIARSGNVFGGGDLNWDRIVPGTIRSLIRNENPIIRSDGKYTRDYIYVKDLVDGYIRIAERDGNSGADSEAFNFGYGQTVNVLEIVNLIRRAMGREDLVPEICDNVVGEIRDQYLSAAKAKSQLGWNPKYRLENGLEETLTWYREYFCS